MVPDFIFIDLLGKFIVFADNIFSAAYSANYKLKIRNKNNVRIFYGKLVILPPDDDQLSKEEQIDGIT